LVAGRRIWIVIWYQLWRATWANGQDARMYLVFKNLGEILNPWRGRNSERLSMGIRFPIPSELMSVPHHVTFWLDAAHAAVRASADARPFAFWTSAEASRAAVAECHLFLFLREPTTRTFAYLLRPDLNSDFICELDSDGGDALTAARDALPSRIRTLLGNGDASLRDLLRGIEAADATALSRQS
jgi:hypothetical protein